MGGHLHTQQRYGRGGLTSPCVLRFCVPLICLSCYHVVFSKNMACHGVVIHKWRCNEVKPSGRAPNQAFSYLTLESIISDNKKSSEEKMGPGTGTDIVCDDDKVGTMVPVY